VQCGYLLFSVNGVLGQGLIKGGRGKDHHQENPKLPERPRKTKKDMKDAIVDGRLYRKVGGVDFAA
jgi:hypothetical protein